MFLIIIIVNPSINSFKAFLEVPMEVTVKMQSIIIQVFSNDGNLSKKIFKLLETGSKNTYGYFHC